MTALIVILKGLGLIALAVAAFAALAATLGYEPPAAQTAQCHATAAPICFFTIF